VGQVRTEKESQSAREEGELAHCLEMRREEEVRAAKQSEPARGAHSLESAEEETCQDSKTQKASEKNSPTGERRVRNQGRKTKRVTER
jgi:hypothetical protein